jgi:hypothetical protein
MISIFIHRSNKTSPVQWVVHARVIVIALGGMDINHGGVDILVPGQLLDVLQLHPFLRKHGEGGMP